MSSENLFCRLRNLLRHRKARLSVNGDNRYGGANMFKLKSLSILFITIISYSVLLISYSVLLSSFNLHDSFIIRADCPICKFALDFSSCDSEVSQPAISLYFAHTYFAQESLTGIFEICTIPLNPRAPPVSFPEAVT
jgi:hypothetical protein